MLRPSPLAVTRRTTLGSMLAGSAILLTGCDGDRPTDETTPSPSVETPDEDLDLHLLAEAVLAVDGARALVQAVVSRWPARTTRFAPLIALHEAHLQVLAASSSGPRTTDPVTPTTPPRLPAAVAAILRSEKATQTTLAGLAARSRSGPFARMLASMSAAEAQHLAALLPAATTPSTETTP